MDNTTWHEKIDDYLDGLLPDAERADMDTALAHDPALARVLRLHRAEREALEWLSEEKARADFHRWTADIGPRDPSPASKPLWHKYRWLLVVLGVAVGLAVWKWWADTPSAHPPAMRPAAPAPAIPTTPKPQTETPDASDERETKPPAGPPIAAQKPPKQPGSVAPQPDNSDLSTDEVTAAAWETETQNQFSDPDINTRRSKNETEAEQKFANGLQVYMAARNDADFQRAADTLGQVGPAENKYITAMYVQAHAFFRLRQYEAAADGFRFVHDQRKTIFWDEAKWKEALSLYGAFGVELSQKRVNLSKCRAGAGTCGKYHARLIESLEWVIKDYPPQEGNARRLLAKVQKK